MGKDAYTLSLLREVEAMTRHGGWIGLLAVIAACLIGAAAVTEVTRQEFDELKALVHRNTAKIIQLEREVKELRTAAAPSGAGNGATAQGLKESLPEDQRWEQVGRWDFVRVARSLPPSATRGSFGVLGGGGLAGRAGLKIDLTEEGTHFPVDPIDSPWRIRASSVGEGVVNVVVYTDSPGAKTRETCLLSLTGTQKKETKIFPPSTGKFYIYFPGADCAATVIIEKAAPMPTKDPGAGPRLPGQEPAKRAPSEDGQTQGPPRAPEELNAHLEAIRGVAGEGYPGAKRFALREEISAIGEMRRAADAALPELCDIYKDMLAKNADPWARNRLVEALGRIGAGRRSVYEDRVLETLRLASQEDTFPDVRKNAQQVIAEWGRPIK